jgi:hypothetical protein
MIPRTPAVTIHSNNHPRNILLWNVMDIFPSVFPAVTFTGKNPPRKSTVLDPNVPSSWRMWVCLNMRFYGFPLVTKCARWILWATTDRIFCAVSQQFKNIQGSGPMWPHVAPSSQINSCWWSWTYVFVSLCRATGIFSKKHCLTNLGHIDTQLFNFFFLWTNVYAVAYLKAEDGPGDAVSSWTFTFKFKTSRKYVAQSVVPPGFFLHLRTSTSSSQFFCWWSWTYGFASFWRDIKNPWRRDQILRS